MIVIIGESGCGKSTLQKYIYQNSKMERAIQTTTRPIRTGEKNGEDYYFIDEETYLQLLYDDNFCESAKYRGWFYATPKQELSNNKVLVTSPSGLRQIKSYVAKNNIKTPIISVYLKVDKLSRFISILKRDKESQIDECYRRITSDDGMFYGIENEVDIVLKNENYKFSVENLYEDLKIQLKYKGVLL